MKKRENWIFLLANFLLIVGILFIRSASYPFVEIINSTFYVSFTYLVFLLFLYTVKGGFYDGLTFSFRRFHHLVIKKDYLEEWKEKPLPSEKTNASFYRLIKFQVHALLLLLLCLLILYYFI